VLKSLGVAINLYKFEWILNERKKVAPKKESNLLNNQVTNRP